MPLLTRRIVAAISAASLAGLAVSGCTQPEPTPLPTHTAEATHTPAFASDEEALKAATDAYAAYLKMSDTILSEGGRMADKFATVATGEALSSAVKDVSEYRRRKLHITGSTAFDSARLQSREIRPVESIAIYVCDDVSDIDVFDSSGRSIVKPDRKPRTPFVVTALKTSGGEVLISERSLWEGASYC